MAKKKRATSRTKPAEKASAEETSLGPIEDAMEELESIVDGLESGQTTLSESLENFERGMLLLRHCHQQLEHTAQRIEVLSGMSDDGSAQTTEFDGSATAATLPVASAEDDSATASQDTGKRLF